MSYSRIVGVEKIQQQIFGLCSRSRGMIKNFYCCSISSTSLHVLLVVVDEPIGG